MFAPAESQKNRHPGKAKDRTKIKRALLYANGGAAGGPLLVKPGSENLHSATGRSADFAALVENGICSA